VCNTTPSLDECLATFGRNIENHAPNYTASLLNTPKLSTICLSGHYLTKSFSGSYIPSIWKKA
jgi:hypothetical protein